MAKTAWIACGASWAGLALLPGVVVFSNPAQAAQQSLNLHGFGGWHPDALGFVVGTDDRTLVAGDVNGDGLDDIIEFAADPGLGDADSDVYVAINDSPDPFRWKTKWHDWFCIGREYPLAGDFDGDGRDDIACLIRSEYSGDPRGDVYVALSTGTAFGTSSRWHDWFCIGTEIPFAGDFNGDGKDDLVSFTADANADVYVALSNGGAFVGTAAKWHANFCPTGALPRVGDFNGDGRDDIACFVRSSQTGSTEGDVYVALSTGSSFGPAVQWHGYFSVGNEWPLVGDFNGDGSDDILTILANGTKYVAFSRGSSFQNAESVWHRADAEGIPLTGRFNADLNTDLIAIRETNIGFHLLSASIAHAGGLTPPSSVLPHTFGYATRDHGGPALGARPLLVVLLEGPATGGRLPITHSRAYYDTLAFGPGHPSIAGFYTEMSGGRFTWSRAGVLGPISDPGNPGDNRHYTVQQIAADNGFNFDAFDTNGDNIVDHSELVILLIDNYSTGNGVADPAPQVTVNKPGGGTIDVHSPVAAVGHHAVFDIHAHELAHCIGALDLYGVQGQCAFSVSLMGAVVNTNPDYYDWNRVCYLDIWHRMALGWIEPEIHEIRSGPGAAVINAAQLSAWESDNRPILLYDSARGTNEFYMLEYRTGLFDEGVRICEASDLADHFLDEWFQGYGGTDFASAGYDLWANYRQEAAGVAIYYVRIDSNKKLVLDRQNIVAGKDGSLESRNSVAGDDILQAPNGPITPGPNNVLETPVAQTDGVQGDYLCVLSLTPGVNDRPSRYEINTNTYNHADGALDVEWFDETFLDLDIRIGVGDNRQVAVSWGPRNQPFIESLSATVMWPGSGTARLALQPGGRVQPEVVLYSAETDASHPLTTSGWDFSGCDVSIPPTVPQGHYALQTRLSDGGVTRVSNSLPLTISDPYDLWAYFSIPQGFGRQPGDDPDGDGWDNFAEYAMSSNPSLGGDPGPGVSHGFGPELPSGDRRFFMRWPMASNRPIVDFQLDYSWDLQQWQPVTILQSIADPDPDFNWLKGYCDPDPVNHRAFLKLRFIKTNEP